MCQYACALLFYACNFRLTYNLTSTMNYHRKRKKNDRFKETQHPSNLKSREDIQSQIKIV